MVLVLISLTAHEEAEDKPQPECASGDHCGAAVDSCNALKDQATPTFVNSGKNVECVIEVRFATDHPAWTGFGFGC